MSTPVAKNVIAGELGKFFSNMQGKKKVGIFWLLGSPSKEQNTKTGCSPSFDQLFRERKREFLERETA